MTTGAVRMAVCYFLGRGLANIDHFNVEIQVLAR